MISPGGDNLLQQGKRRGQRPVQEARDLTDDELQAVEDQVGPEIAGRGLPTDNQLLCETKNLITARSIRPQRSAFDQPDNLHRQP